MSRGRGRAASIAANLLLVVGSLVFTFVVLEIAVRLLVDLRLQRPNAIHDVDLSTRLRFLPHKTRTYRTTEFVFHVAFNRFGRRDTEWPDTVIADPTNAIFIGDSLTFGNGVEDQWTLPTLLERLAAEQGRDLEVFNFGMPAGAPPGYKLLLEDAIASGFAARTVLVGVFIGNDFYKSTLTRWDQGEDTPAEPETARTPASPSLLSHSKLLTFIKTRASQSTRVVGWALTLGRWAGITLYDTAGTYIFMREQTPEQQALFRQILDYIGDMQEICERTGRRLFVILLPNRIQVENAGALTSTVYDPAKPDDAVMDYCGERGLACLDLFPILRGIYLRTGKPLYYPIDRHMTPEGNALAADAIWAFLERENAEITRPD